jgi:hypothetical protein
LGTVDSVSSSEFVVTSQFAAGKVTVKTNAKTTFSATSVVKSSALVTGSCATAIGSKTSSGTVDALSITISAPINGKCPAATPFAGPGGFGGGFGGGRPAGGSASAAADNA